MNKPGEHLLCYCVVYNAIRAIFYGKLKNPEFHSWNLNGSKEKKNWCHFDISVYSRILKADTRL